MPKDIQGTARMASWVIIHPCAALGRGPPGVPGGSLQDVFGEFCVRASQARTSARSHTGLIHTNPSANTNTNDWHYHFEPHSNCHSCSPGHDASHGCLCVSQPGALVKLGQSRLKCVKASQSISQSINQSNQSFSQPTYFTQQVESLRLDKLQQSCANKLSLSLQLVR